MNVVWAAILASAVMELIFQLGAGNVPVPSEMRWAVPILVAALKALADGLRPAADADGSDERTEE